MWISYKKEIFWSLFANAFLKSCLSCHLSSPSEVTVLFLSLQENSIQLQFLCHEVILATFYLRHFRRSIEKVASMYLLVSPAWPHAKKHKPLKRQIWYWWVSLKCVHMFQFWLNSCNRNGHYMKAYNSHTYGELLGHNSLNINRSKKYETYISCSVHFSVYLAIF
jgi:hypothetical protein